MKEDHEGHEHNEECMLDPEETVTSPTRLLQVCSLQPQHHSKSQNFKLNFICFSSKDTLGPIPETNMVGIRLGWSPLANYNIYY